MRTFPYTLAFVVLVSLGICACNSGMKIPANEDMRASLSPVNVEKFNNIPAIGTEENSLEIRSIIHEAIRSQLLKVGQYPRRVIKASELLSLVHINAATAPSDSTWSYSALLRLNFETTVVNVRFIIFSRDGEFVVRKVST